jgi:hypothetical protein
LTLLTSPMNSAQSNRPWLPSSAVPEGKRAALAKHTVLHLNKAVADQDVWDDGADRDAHVQTVEGRLEEYRDCRIAERTIPESVEELLQMGWRYVDVEQHALAALY